MFNIVYVYFMILCLLVFIKKKNQSLFIYMQRMLGHALFKIRHELLF